MPSHHYFVIYKPFGFLSQFTVEIEGQKTLADLYDFPSSVYPLGRLDKNSEGLLILTDDKTLNHQLLDPSVKKEKTYLVQVEGSPTDEDLAPLRNLMRLRIKKRDVDLQPAIVRIVQMPPVNERTPPIRSRSTIPTSWLEIKIKEGKFHQVRKMCASIGFPVLRLIRSHVGNFKIPSYEIGKVWRINRDEIV